MAARRDSPAPPEKAPPDHPPVGPSPVPALSVRPGRYDPDLIHVLGGTMRARITTIATLTAALALSLTGCGGQGDAKAGPTPSASSETASPTPDMVDQLIEWRDGGGSKTLDTFLKDITAVDKASDPVDLGGLRNACADLAAHVETAELGDPIPDKTANNSWKLALDHFAASATACTNGAVSDSQDDFDRMASEMDIGIRHMTAVSERIGEFAPE